MPDYDDAGDLVFLALLVAGGYIALNVWRNAQAAAGSPFFAPTPPAPAPGGDFLNVLAPMQLSPAGEDFIKGLEGWTATAKPDAGGQVIGWGHEILPGESFPGPISYAKGQQLFDSDAAIAESAVNNGVTVQLDQNQFDALVDFAFNEGAAAFAGSTLLRLLNSGDFAGAAAQLNQWIYSQGRILPALQARRLADEGLFQS